MGVLGNGLSLFTPAIFLLMLILPPVAVFPDWFATTALRSTGVLPGAVQANPSPDRKDDSLSNQQLEVSQVNQRFYKALSSQSLRAMGKVWLQESWVKCVHPNWDLLIGWKRIRKSWATIFRNTEHMEVKAANVFIQVTGDSAWVSCTENIESYQNANFSRSQAQATNLFQRVKGKWYMVHHHASPITIRPGDVL